MSLFRRFFNRKPPDRLLEISDRVYVFDCCFSTDVLEEDEYKVYMGGVVAELQDYYPDSSFMVSNFREGDIRSHISDILSQYNMTVTEYPRQYEGCPVIPLEMIYNFLRSSESWLSLGQRNVLLMHCERGGWPILAFMLAALLLYRKQYSNEQKTLEMVYEHAPRELRHLLTPLNPQPSQLRYLQYISRRNEGSDWPPSDTALALDHIILKFLPLFGEMGCRPVIRIYGQDSSSTTNRGSKLLFTSPITNTQARYFQPEEFELVKIDIHHRVQGDVVVECYVREEVIFRVMFHTTYVRSSVLILSCGEVDAMWDARDQIPKNFTAEVCFSDVDALPQIKVPFQKEFGHLRIRLEDIKLATDNFGENKFIGKGGFGKVYQGEVSHSKGNSMAAFKRLDPRFGQGDPEFWKEVLMLSSYKHKNLISLLGFCDEAREKILVYEYASNGSLDRHLSSTHLTWIQRIKICVDVARGIGCLHNDKGTQRVIHRDIKSSNILLDDNWNAKVSDMGLSKIGPANQPHTFLITGNIAGTPGYCDPQYMTSFTLSKESDIYSFGVVLFEVLCGRLCYNYSDGKLDKILVPTWKKAYREKKLHEIVFQDLIMQPMDSTSLEIFSGLAFQCLQEYREDRPTIAHAVEKLEIALKFEFQKLPDKYEDGLELLENDCTSSSLTYKTTKPNMLVEDVEKFFSPEPETWFSVDEEPVGFALVEILEGSDMKPSAMSGLANPYIKGELGAYRFKTKIQKKTLSPKWCEEFKIPIASWDSPNLLAIGVHNKNLIFDDTLGDCCVKINDFRDGERHDMWLPLHNIKMGRLHLAVKVIEAEEKVVEQHYDGHASKRESKKEDGAADHSEPIDVKGQKKTGIWVHRPGKDIAQVWEPRKGKNRVPKDSSIRSEPSTNDSSSSDECLEGNKPPIDVEGQKETAIWVHHPGKDVAQVWEPRKGKNRVYKDSSTRS